MPDENERAARWNGRTKKSERGNLLNPDFISTCLIVLLLGSTVYMLNGVLAKYVLAIFGNATYAGVLNLAFSLCAIATRLVSGSVSDRAGHVRTMLIGAAVFFLAILGFSVWPALAAMVVFRGIQGIGFAFASTGASAAGVESIPARRMNQGISLLSLGTSLATAVGPVVGVALIAGDDFAPAFAATLVVGGASCLLSLFCCVRKRRERTTEPLREDGGAPASGRHARTGLARLVEPASMPATAVQFFAFVAQSAVNTYIVVFAESRGIGGSALFFTVMAISMCLVRLVAGRLMDGIGLRRSAVAALAMDVACFALLASCHAEPAFFLAAVLVGTGQGILSPCMQACAVTAAPPERNGVANSTFQLGNDLGTGVGSMLWGVLIDAAGYEAMFAGCIVSCGIALALVFALHIGQGKEA